jgi:histidine triad (HIT) family protein
MASIFTRIINGELPCFKIYENEHVLAFLSRFSIQPGHVLIVPKREIDLFADVPEPYYSAVFAAAKPISKALKRATGCRRVGMMIQGWDVPHFHCHLVPMFGTKDMDPSNARELGFNENREMCERIVTELAEPKQNENESGDGDEPS